MTIKEAISALRKEKRSNLPSRFPCRAIMVSTIEQYRQLLSELKEIGDIRMARADEIFPECDVMPRYSNLSDAASRGEWVILAGVSEYLRLFSRDEAVNRRFSTLWSGQVPASSIGRIIIPMWGCEAQWFDPAINLNGDPRQDDFYYDCTDKSLPEQEMSLLVLSGAFEKLGISSILQKDDRAFFFGLREWFEYWEDDSPACGTEFILLTKRFRSITPASGLINIRVLGDILSFLREEMAGGGCLTEDNCSKEMQSILFEYAAKGDSLDVALLAILNLSSFSGVDIMGKWNSLTPSHKRFAKLWLQIHPDASYLCHCFSMADSVDEAPDLISHEIFKSRKENPEWVVEFKSLLSVLETRPDSSYFKAVDMIPEFEDRLDFLLNKGPEFRIHLLQIVGQWMREDKSRVFGCGKLKKTFPELFAYLSHDYDRYQEGIKDYMSRYKAHKLENSLPQDEESYFKGVDPFAFDHRYSLLSKYEDGNTIFLWVDALGVEWLPLLCWGIKKKNDCRIASVAVAQATLPTETASNEQWKKMGSPFKKLNGLDKLAHKGVVDEPDYYACIKGQMNFVVEISNKVSELLKTHQRVVVTGDHGTSRLAARFFHNREGIDVPPDAVARSHGRYCELQHDVEISMPKAMLAKGDLGEKYIVLGNYDHFTQSGFAAGADDDSPIYGEVHGGSTPEEMLVPVVVVESGAATGYVASWEKPEVKISMKKAKPSIVFNKPVECLSVKIAGRPCSSAAKDEAHKTWMVVAANAKAGTFNVEAIADGHVVDLPTITFLPALGGGNGDL